MPGGDGSGQRQHQERHGQGRRQELGRTPRGLGSPATAPCCAAAAQPVQDDQQRDQARDRQRLEGRERKHARRADSHGGRGRPEEGQRHRGEQRERAHADQAGRAHPGAGAPRDRLGHRRHSRAGPRRRRARAETRRTAGPFPAIRRSGHLPCPCQSLSPLSLGIASPRPGIPPSLLRGMRRSCPSCQRRRRPLPGVTTVPGAVP